MPARIPRLGRRSIAAEVLANGAGRIRGEDARPILSRRRGFYRRRKSATLPALAGSMATGQLARGSSAQKESATTERPMVHRGSAGWAIARYSPLFYYGENVAGHRPKPTPAGRGSEIGRDRYR